nr:ThiF family adenylyltransferase [Kineococcus aurantiacus]
MVEPAAGLTPAERRRYARQLQLPGFGEQAQLRLKNSRVLVVGAGGLGSPVLLYLAAAGVGTLGVVDDDVVEESNLHRQVLHPTASTGRSKAESAREELARANPHVRVVAHAERLTAANALDLVAGYDLVVDGSDNFTTRYLVNDACVLAGRPWVWGAVLRFEGQVAVFRHGHGPTYRDLFPDPPAPGTVPNCAEAGVIGSVCAAVGAAMVTETVKLLTGTGRSLLGRVSVHDAFAGTWRSFALTPDPDREPVTALAEPAHEISAADLAARLAAREAGRDDFVLVDVREPAEHAARSIPGAVLVPLARLLVDPDALPDGELVLHCAGGTRSALAVQTLLGRGRTDVCHLRGGIAAWTGRTA